MGPLWPVSAVSWGGHEFCLGWVPVVGGLPGGHRTGAGPQGCWAGLFFCVHSGVGRCLSEPLQL